MDNQICQKRYEEYGNNAQPVNNGDCCDKCNNEIVIPARMKMRQRSQTES